MKEVIHETEKKKNQHETQEMLGRSSDRIPYIDLLRALGIILMIMGHIGFGGLFDKWIHIFHMPMFFIISGYFFRKKSLLETIKRKARTLLIPYIVFGVFHIAIYTVIKGTFSTEYLYLFLWENTAGGGIPIAGALWFLTALFFAEIIFCLIQYIKSECIIDIVVCLTSFGGIALATFLPIRLPWALDVAMVATGLMRIGQLLKEKWAGLLDINVLFSLLGLAVFSFLGLWLNNDVNLRTGLYGDWLLFWVDAVGVTLSLWILCRWIHNRFSKCLLTGKVLKWLNSIGRDSILYLCLNQLFILASGKAANMVIKGEGTLIVLLKQCLVLAISLAGPFIVQKVIMNTGLRCLMGKKVSVSAPSGKKITDSI